MTLKSCLICSTVRESSFPERGRRLDMWHWGMLLTPSWPSTAGQLQAAPGQVTQPWLPWGRKFWRRWLAPNTGQDSWALQGP